MSIPRRKIRIFILDLVFLGLVATMTALLQGREARLPVIISLLVFPLGFYLAGLYERQMHVVSTMFAARLLAVLGVSLLLVSSISFSLPEYRISRSLFAGLAVGVAVLLPPWRWLVDRLVEVSSGRISVAIVGSGSAGEALVRALDGHDDFEIVGIYDDDRTRWGQPVGRYNVTGPTAELSTRDWRHAPEMVAVAITHDKSPALLRTLVDCRRAGMMVTDIVTAYEAAVFRLPVDHVSDTWIAFWSQLSPVRGGLQRKLKRLTDLVSAVVLLIVLAVPLALAAFAVWVSSGSPILYRQRRLGEHGRSFEIYKLRTMRVDAERDTGAVWAVQGDRRATGVGRFLRRWRLDEIPQLVNVLRGDMSLVGPRPERPEFVNQLVQEIPYYNLRHMMKPGITGWAQVSHPYGASVDDARIKLEYDLYYIRHFGTVLDLRILLKTIQIFLAGKGGR
jgi:exopolysaccharide biosynthesis polyprenyl glycosylphosphotransferase